MDKFFKIAIISWAVIMLVALAWFLSSIFWPKEDKIIPVVKEDLGPVSELYGMQVHQKCRDEYQAFLDKYGADYSKCSVDFDFSETYCAGYDPDTQALSDVNIIVILDSSGSMVEKIGQYEKIDIAKKAVADFLANMPQGVNTSLVVYGHKGSNSAYDKNLSCKEIEEIVRLGKNDYEKILSAMGSFKPRGWTPLAGSLEYAKNLLKNSGDNNKNYIVLLSDGSESCDGDPLSAAENLKLELKNIKLIVIGFSDDKNIRQLLGGVAKMGGGSYVSAVDSKSIADAFNEQLLTIKKDCLKMTFLRISARYNANNLSNLNCWLDSYDKESKSFESVFSGQACAPEVSEILNVRHADYWRQKQDLEGKNADIYNGLQLEYNAKIKEFK